MQIYLALCDKYAIEIAENVRSAMYLLRKMKPEILLMEYSIEQLNHNGHSPIKFLKKVKRKYNDLKVVTILDDKDENLAKEVQSNGADEVLYKPIKNRFLISRMRKLSNHKAS